MDFVNMELHLASVNIPSLFLRAVGSSRTKRSKICTYIVRLWRLNELVNHRLGTIERLQSAISLMVREERKSFHATNFDTNIDNFLEFQSLNWGTFDNLKINSDIL